MQKKIILFFLLILLVSNVNAGKSITVDIPCSSLKRSLKAVIILPSTYDKKEKFPVVYLLHGFSGNYQSWSKIVPLKDYADKYKVIFVCPDGNFDSWYLDSPYLHGSQFETYICKEVVPYIDGYYSTVKNYHGRVIIGSSMGGHGAVTLLCKNPNLFIGAGSISGIMDLREFPEKWGIKMVLGQLGQDDNLWKGHSFVGMFHLLKGKNRELILDCGVDDFALAGNRQVHELLLKENIPHEYYERPGEHTFEYPKKVLEYHLFHFSKVLRSK